MDSVQDQRVSLPRIIRRIETWSDVLVCEGDDCRAVQVKELWWVNDDGTVSSAIYRTDNPLLGEADYLTDPVHHHLICRKIARLRRLAVAP
jgi:hypothetical protein